MANDDAVQDLLPNPRDELEYIERVHRLIQRADERVSLGEELRKRLLMDHVGDGWLRRLEEVYQQTDRMLHSPAPIPASSCSTSDVDVGLSLWNVVSDGRTTFAGEFADSTVAVFRHKAYLAKYVGDYAKARRAALHAVRYDPYQRTSWRLLAVSFSGKWGQVVRRLLSPA